MSASDPRKFKSMPNKWTYLQGYIFKEMIRSILEESDYRVMPFGWETFLSNLKRDMANKKSEASYKVRVAPDLIVHDSDIFELVEVKATKEDFLIPQAFYLAKKSKNYWPEAIFAIVRPFKHWFYAERFEKIDFEKKKDEFFDQFKPFEEMFPKANVDTLYMYKQIANKIFQISGYYQMESRNCPEMYDAETPEKTTYNEHLKQFVDTNPSDSDDELFKKYQKECLISRRIFDYNLKAIKTSGQYARQT